MEMECIASALNVRTEPNGRIAFEVRQGDILAVSPEDLDAVWCRAQVLNGVSAGREGWVRRKWIIQHLRDEPRFESRGRRRAAKVIEEFTTEFDWVAYQLGSQPRSWEALRQAKRVDCSGWVFLLAKEIIGACALNLDYRIFATYSDQQVVRCGVHVQQIVSGRFITDRHFIPGVLVGVDFSEYSWDRNRPLDIDHVLMVGDGPSGAYISQSSGSGGGVNRVPLARWIASQRSLISGGRVHLVDLLAGSRQV